MSAFNTQSVSKQLSLCEALWQLIHVYPWNLTVGCVVQAIQQLAGINTVMYYGPFILRDAGFGEDNNKSLLENTLPLSIVGFLGGMTAIFISENKGRRASMLCVLPILACSMIALSVAMLSFYFLDKQDFGGWFALLSLFIYLFSFQMGISGQPWSLCSEIFPTHVRGVSNSITTFANFFFNFIVAAVFLSATSTDTGKVISYLIIASFCLVGYCFINKFVPETKGRSLQECVHLFMTPKQIELESQLKIANQQHPGSVV